jgi:hypothetical protein
VFGWLAVALSVMIRVSCSYSGLLQENFRFNCSTDSKKQKLLCSIDINKFASCVMKSPTLQGRFGIRIGGQ